MTEVLAPVIAWLAHSHSASQFRRHLPSHWNSNILPPHCGHTRLMIEEMMLAFDSPGSVSKLVIVCLLIPKSQTRAKDYSANHNGPFASRVFTLSSSVLVGCEVRSRPHRPAADSLTDDNATAMPSPKENEQLLAKGLVSPRAFECQDHRQPFGSCQPWQQLFQSIADSLQRAR